MNLLIYTNKEPPRAYITIDRGERNVGESAIKHIAQGCSTLTEFYPTRPISSSVPLSPSNASDKPLKIALDIVQLPGQLDYPGPLCMEYGGDLENHGAICVPGMHLKWDQRRIINYGCGMYQEKTPHLQENHPAEAWGAHVQLAPHLPTALRWTTSCESNWLHSGNDLPGNCSQSSRACRQIFHCDCFCSFRTSIGYCPRKHLPITEIRWSISEW